MPDGKKLFLQTLICDTLLFRYLEMLRKIGIDAIKIELIKD